MSGGYSQRTTPEIRPRIPAVVRATCPPQAMELRRRKDGASIHRTHTRRFVTLELRCATYRRCQGRPVRLREACAPLQICSLIDCLPATWRQHVTRKPPCTAADRPQQSFFRQSCSVLLGPESQIRKTNISQLRWGLRDGLWWLLSASNPKIIHCFCQYVMNYIEWNMFEGLNF